MKTIFSFVLLCLGLTSLTVVAEEKLVVCYYGTWATYRSGLGKFDVGHIDPHLCTHLIYTFVGIDNQGNVLSLDPYLDLPDNWGRNNFKNFNDLKKVNPKLKTILAVGGWNEGSAKYSVMAADPSKRKNFITSALRMIQTHGFDGFDVDWEYPNQRDSVHGKADIDNFTILLKELKEAFQPYGLLLTAAVAAVEKSAALSYDIPAISKYLDFINIMAYDLYGAWDPETGHNAALHKSQGYEGNDPQTLNTVDIALKYWLDQGCPPEKLVLGVPLYGRTFTLSNPNQNGVRAPASGAGISGPYTATNGFIGYNELCSRMLTESWDVRFDELGKVPYAVLGRNWVSYDNPQSLAEKVNYGSKYDIAGYMVWSIETDDFHGICHGERFALLKALNRAAEKSPSTDSPDLPPTTKTPEVSSTTKSPDSTVTTPSLPLCSTTWSTTTPATTTTTTITSTTNPSTTTTTTTPNPTTTTTPKPTQRPTTWTPAPTTTTTPKDTDSSACREPGFQPNPADCSSFFICVDLGYGDLFPHKFHCPIGLHWDDKGHFCDYASIVNCSA